MLQVHSLSVSFSSFLGLTREDQCVVRCLDLNVKKGEVMAVVGQSGGGKSLLAHALMGLLPRNARLEGSLIFEGCTLTPRHFERLRGREIALVPQSVSYLNPLLRVGLQIARAAKKSGLSRQKAHTAAMTSLKRYGLGQEAFRRYPFQLSGGMSRRVLTATATVGRAKLILADEPTNGLDQEIALETLNHLRQLADEGKAVLLITHDIEAALKVADRVTVVCGGVTVEEATSGDFNGDGRLRHPYTKALWEALPGNSFMDSLHSPAHGVTQRGCPFHVTCQGSGPLCEAELPPFRNLDGGRVRCRNA